MRMRPSYTGDVSQPKPDFHHLSVPERIRLVEDIWDSIVDTDPNAVPLTDTQRKEVRRRIESHDAGGDAPVPWEDVRSRLFQRDR